MQVTCPKCNHVNVAASGDPLDSCPSCGLIYSRFDAAAAMRERVFRARNTGDFSGIPRDQVPQELWPQAAAGVIVTTTPIVPGRAVAQVLDVVSGECVYGVNVLRDLLSAAVDITGGRNGSAQKVLRDARTAAIAQVKGEAYGIGADAVIGLQFTFNEIAGGGKSMIYAVAAGTAVKLSA
ncbi:heavy metal-binding domain-containing protein [Comamonas thiooxydans]|uniref:UPF0145 protein N5D63_03705 n=1 Tax=Comamonas thiooxydans TaxID=363952 RepID=A0AA42PY97_9BURK|nr:MULTISPECIES: heavy metal-binding domain-containing protein [Comamonas]MDH1333249.1 heavy metal-binding domain-containing protein [Comamonas thiooxydans]MDH1738978.1 heavy metal-binding domain-containing protein [Comamonas thiooxydans]MDH1786119.1 heavy metal-binding domain-containing protein [Comamonas thiooxydans]